MSENGLKKIEERLKVYQDPYGCDNYDRGERSGLFKAKEFVSGDYAYLESLENRYYDLWNALYRLNLYSDELHRALEQARKERENSENGQ